jgi:hypothetical protein
VGQKNKCKNKKLIYPSLTILHGLARPNHFARCRQIKLFTKQKIKKLLEKKASPRDSLGLLTMLERDERRRGF